MIGLMIFNCSMASRLELVTRIKYGEELSYPRSQRELIELGYTFNIFFILRPLFYPLVYTDSLW